MAEAIEEKNDECEVVEGVGLQEEGAGSQECAAKKKKKKKKKTVEGERPETEGATGKLFPVAPSHGRLASCPQAV